MQFMTLEESWVLIVRNEKLEYSRRGFLFETNELAEVVDYYKDKACFYFYGDPHKCLLAFKELDAHTCLVTELYVCPKERLRGLSVKLFERVFNMFYDHDFLVNVNSKNSIGAKAYRKSGFKFVKVIDTRSDFDILQYKKERSRI